MTITVVFVPSTKFVIYVVRCLEYCAAKGYDVAGVVTGDWRAVLAMLGSGHADVAVVARPDHACLPGAPRVEVAISAEKLAAPATRRPKNAGVVLRPAVPRRAAAPAAEPSTASVDITRRANAIRRPRPRQ